MSVFKSENLLSLVTATFGLITLFASSSVLFGYSNILDKEGYYPSFILWINLLSSPLYLLAAIGFKLTKKWTLYLLLVILGLLFVNLAFFIQLMQSGENYETDTLAALLLRIAFTAFLAFLETYKSRTNNSRTTRLRALFALLGIFSIGSSMASQEKLFSLRVEAGNFRNSEGVAQFALYNEDGSIPDENLNKHFKKKVGQIRNGKSSVTFKNVPKGHYAVTILHDENSNGKIDKILFLPKEGFGISNFDKISLSNRPNFSKASFELSEDTTKTIKLIYK